MPFIAKHVRLTNSGRLPDVFLTSKVQSPTDLADAKLGKLYFVIQINAPWNHASTIGSSIINVVGREYYRQEGHVPLENFERAIAKANRLIEQLIRDGEVGLNDNLHALIGLAVGDEIHISYAGAAEAYFLRDGSLNLITEPGMQKGEASQAFNNLVTGEVSANDIVLLGSPGLYGALTTEELETILKQQSLSEASLAIARRLKSMKIRKANAIAVQFTTIQAAENNTISHEADTIYLDQAIDSSWDIAKYYLGKIGRPLAKGFTWLGTRLGTLASKATEATSKTWQQSIQPKLSQATEKTASKLQQTKLPDLSKVVGSVKQIKPPLPNLGGVKETAEAGVPVNYYGSNSRRRKSLASIAFLATPLRILQEIGQQFRAAVRRSPRTWYMVIAVVLLASIGASIQTQKERNANNPTANATTVEEMKVLINDAKQAKVYGDQAKARELYLSALEKAELVKSNAKLATANAELINAAEKDLFTLAGASELSSVSPLLSLPAEIDHAAIHEGIMYFVTSDGSLQSQRLTGGESTRLEQLPDSQAVNELYFDTAGRTIYIQTYTGNLYHYNLSTETLKHNELLGDNFPVATGLSMFSNTLYLLDPANNQIWKYPVSEGAFSTGSSYLKNTKTSLADTINLAIDGSVFALHKNGTVSKFTRGAITDFKLNGLPAPFDAIEDPLGFYAVEDGENYYLADRGNNSIQPRLIEFDKNGKFIHQYFMPKDWQGKIRTVVGNPKSHKAWVVVGKDLYEFTLVQ